MTKTVVFVGHALRSNLNILLKEGYQVGMIMEADFPQAGEKFKQDILPYLSFVIPVKFTNLETIEKSLKNVYLHPDTLLICTRDRYFYAQAKIADYLNLNQSKLMSIKMARDLTNKFYQRKVFSQKYPEITPAFKKIRTFHGAYTFTRKYGFPVIVKPANLSMGKLVNICNNLEELIQKVSYVLDHVSEVYKEQRVNRQPQVIIEQYIEGRQFSVDSYVDYNGKITHTPVCYQVISHDLGEDDFETYYSQYPSGISEAEEKTVFETVSKAIQAMGVIGTPTHTEVRLNKKGECKIVEVNVRTGGYRGDMLLQSYDFNHIKNALNTYLNKPAEVKTKFLKYSACPQFWSQEEGIFTDVDGVEEAKKLKSFVYFGDVVARNHSMVGPASKGFPKVCYLILAHEDKKVLESDLKTVRELIKIKVS